MAWRAADAPDRRVAVEDSPEPAPSRSRRSAASPRSTRTSRDSAAEKLRSAARLTAPPVARHWKGFVAHVSIAKSLAQSERRTRLWFRGQRDEHTQNSSLPLCSSVSPVVKILI